MRPVPAAADLELLEAFLDSLHDPFLFVDTDHVIRRMNRVAIAHYKEGESLIGRSIFDCHNERSCRVIREVFAAMQDGEEERPIADNRRHRIFMRAVRDRAGCLIGYYERYEPPRMDRQSAEDAGPARPNAL